MLPDTHLLLAFIGASFVLTIIPGPAVVYILARTLSQGRTSGLSSVFGVALGNLANAIGAGLGLAALFAVSSVAFTVIKWAGAAYLIYLGVKLLMAPAGNQAAPQVESQSLKRVFRDGFLVALLNPKTTLFFAAFMPQFMNPNGHLLAQTTALGSIFVIIACCTDIFYVLTASLLAPYFGRAKKSGVWGNRLAGVSFIGLGLLTAFGSKPAKHS